MPRTNGKPEPDPVALLDQYVRTLDKDCKTGGFVFTTAEEKRIDDAIMKIRILVRDYREKKAS